jgi:hypothetical protein
MDVMTHTPRTPMTRLDSKNRLALVTWRDVFVVVDHGRGHPADYLKVGDLVTAGAAPYARGIGGLIIVPPSAPAPSDEMRTAMNSVLRRLGASLRCVSWSVEGGGFQGAMVRGVITGMKLFARLPFKTHVTTNLTDALTWTVRQLDGDDGRVQSVSEGVRWVEEQRQQLEDGTG